MSGFARVFGDFYPVAKKQLEKGRECLRINLLWSDSHSYSDKDLKFVASESRRYNALCAAFPDRHIEIAPLTEHNLASPDKFLSVVKANAPNCGKPVNTPWKGALTRNPAYKNEVHNPSHAKPNIPGVGYNYSDDGTNSVDSDTKATQAKFADAEMLCVWHPRLNLKWSMKDSTPRPERKALPSPDVLRSLTYLFTEKGPVSLPKKWTLKSHAEKHGPADTKGDKLLIISPLRGNEIVLKRGGQRIGGLTYYGPFDGGGYRYYAPQFGYKYGPAAEVWFAGKKYGIVNPGFRAGSFR